MTSLFGIGSKLAEVRSMLGNVGCSVSEKQAEKLLKNAGYSVEAACDAFFEAQGSSGVEMGKLPDRSGTQPAGSKRPRVETVGPSSSTSQVGGEPASGPETQPTVESIREASTLVDDPLLLQMAAQLGQMRLELNDIRQKMPAEVASAVPAAVNAENLRLALEREQAERLKGQVCLANRHHPLIPYPILSRSPVSDSPVSHIP
jgi:hypothetical protein